MICSMLLKLKFGGDNPHRISLTKERLYVDYQGLKKTLINPDFCFNAKIKQNKEKV